jgi:hypothetical protein
MEVVRFHNPQHTMDLLSILENAFVRIFPRMDGILTVASTQ